MCMLMFSSQLVICCLWTFSFQVIAITYYLYSAELPSALLRGKSLAPHPGPLFACDPFLIFFADMTHSQDWTRHFPRKLHHGHCHLVRPYKCFPGWKSCLTSPQLRHSTHATRARSQDWFRLWRFLRAHLYTHVALSPRDQSVSQHDPFQNIIEKKK